MSDNVHPEAFGIWSRVHKYWWMIFRNQDDAEKRAAEYCDCVDVVRLIPEPEVEAEIERRMAELRQSLALTEASHLEIVIRDAEQRGRDAEWEKFVRRVAVLCKGFGSRRLVAVSEIVGLLEEIESGEQPGEGGDK